MASSEGSVFADPGFWVAASGVAFIGLVWWQGGFKAVASMLDGKIDQIRKDIDEAARLRAEAEALLGKYQKQQRDAEKTAAEIVAAAENEAAEIMAKAEADIEAMIARRTKLTNDRIAQAEANAVKEVRGVAANVAVEAATEVLTASLKGAKGSGLVDAAISDVENRLH